MTRRLVLLLLTVAGTGFARAQSVTYSTPDTAYMRHVEVAFGHLQRGECRPCLDAYEKAFRIAQKSYLSLLRAATCAYSCREKKLAAQYLDKALALEWDGPHQVFTTYPEFKPYHNTPFEKDLLARQDRIIRQLGLDAGLIRELTAIRKADERYRLQVDSVIKTYGRNSEPLQALHRRMWIQDSLNLIEVEELIARHGYPGKSKVGTVQSATAFLVLQHSALPVMEKYLPLLQDAAARGELDRASFAMFTDRVRMYRGEKQVYGTQVYTRPGSDAVELYPLEEEGHVDERRAEVGLGPLREYLKQWNIEYPPKG
jgi:hypothetical protein